MIMSLVGDAGLYLFLAAILVLVAVGFALEIGRAGRAARYAA